MTYVQSPLPLQPRSHPASPWNILSTVCKTNCSCSGLLCVLHEKTPFRPSNKMYDVFTCSLVLFVFDSAVWCCNKNTQTHTHKRTIMLFPTPTDCRVSVCWNIFQISRIRIFQISLNPQAVFNVNFQDSLPFDI